ncbi:MAG: tetratricopeptide repeat protein [bacterium]
MLLSEFRHLRVWLPALVLAVMMGCGSGLEPQERAREFYERGMEAAEKHDYGTAIVDLKYAIHLNPAYREAYYSLGVVYQNVGGLENATESFESFLQFSPDHLDTHIRLAKIYKLSRKSRDTVKEAEYVLRRIPGDSDVAIEMHLILGETYLYETQQIDRALSHYQKVSEKRPDMIDPYLSFSKYYFNRKQLAEGEKMLQKVLKIDPLNPEALKLLQDLYREKKNWNGLIQLYRSSIDRTRKKSHDRDSEIKTRIKLANLYFKLKRYREAGKEAEKILKLDSQEPNAKFIMGENAFRNKDYDTALYYFLYLRNSKFNIETVFLRLAEIYDKKGLDEEVSETYEKLIFIRPNNFRAHLFLVRHCYKKKQYHKGLLSAIELANRFSGFPESFFYIGKGYFFQNKFELAIDSFQKFFMKIKELSVEDNELMDTKYPDLAVPEEYKNRNQKNHAAQAYYLLGVSYLVGEQYEKAREQFKKGLFENSNLIDLFLYKAILAQMLGDFSTGIVSCDVAIASLETNKPLCYFIKGIILISKGELAKAKKILKEGASVIYGKDLDSLKITNLYNAADDGGLSHLNLGVIFLFNGWKKEALHELGSALEANPDNQIARYLKDNMYQIFSGYYNNFDRVYNSLQQDELLRKIQDEER